MVTVIRVHRGGVVRRLFALWLLVVATPAVSHAAPITSLFVFGDSLLDQGNGFLLTGGFPPPPYAQRASNGPVAAERLASVLGVPLAPSVAGGTNYAVVGATTGPIVVPGSSPPVVTDNFAAITYMQPALFGTGVLAQVQDFIATGPVTDPNGALFLVWGGANDFFIDNSPAAIPNAVTNLGNAIATLYADGARRFLVPNLPDLSLTPSGLAAPPLVRAQLQALSVAFNSLLTLQLNGLDQLPGINITRFNTFALLSAVSANPGAFGFTNASDPCLTGILLVGGTVCSTPDQFLFWDTAHPTAAGHRLLGDAFARAVPEPATLALLGFGFALRVATRRRR